MTPLRGKSAFGDRWGQTIYSVALSGNGRFNVSTPETRRVSCQMQLDKIMLKPEEDDDQQQYLLLTVNDKGQQAADPTSTAHNPSLHPPITL
ncbi:hypothetical protein BT96DRAFT_998722 [Gymnopus androsaceus JB14]|uniref:Uncharacterized protein n=1 Tax=Gymnopus androsaceus JB14 TaxID=1447944 RepID=A0A6A4HA07_9AGAR|nr:hypothetical protein BT96DRAFT_998722 [Gymnopus androsaceus JB14]